jgi:large subunit ribosomal protein L24
MKSKNRKTRLKVGELVEIIAGKEKGKRGKLLKINIKSGRALVEGISLSKRHLKAQAQSEGGIILKESSIDLSNMMAVAPET